MRILPVNFVWQMVEVTDPDTGESEHRMAMVPLKRYGNVCKRQFSENEEYPLAPIEARSRASHSHFFASLHEAFANLPEDETRFPTVEHWRKWMLVQEGFCTETNYVCASPDHARRLAAGARRLNEYVVIAVKGNIVRIFEPKSQSAAAMGKDEFEDSKRKLLDRAAAMVGVRRTELEKHARRSA